MLLYLIPIWDFFQEHSRITLQQEKGEAILLLVSTTLASFTGTCTFDCSREIIASSRT